jgi:AcrR family transcriptional regulator
MRTEGRAPSEGAAPKRLTPTSTRDGLPLPGIPRNGARPGSVRQAGRRGQIAEVQRARMLAALVEVANEHGAANVTVAHVVARSGVSRRTFYELFEDREDCFLAAFDDAIEEIAAAVVPACERPAKWHERIRAGLTALLELLEYERPTSRLVIVETLGAGPRALERRRRVLAHVITAVDEGRAEVRQGDGPPALTAEGVVGAVLSVLHARLSPDAGPLPAYPPPEMGQPARPPASEPPVSAKGRAKGEKNPGGLLELAGPLMSMIVLPYLGPAAARREAARPLPKPTRHSRSRARGHPLQQLGMRLTYRTMRVLMAIAAQPGSSNRQVADAAEISDQGQTSKLLGRLFALGLIENAGPGRIARGEPNSWQLTAKGIEIESAIAEQTLR